MTRRNNIKDSDIQVLPNEYLLTEALKNPLELQREINNRSLYEFIQYFWHIVSPHKFSKNWHIELICKELERLANDVAFRRPRENDLIINVPPGTTKTITVSIMFPAWCWTKWFWMRFITASYTEKLALESAEYCRDLVLSDEFQTLYPEISIREDKNTKSNFKIVKRREGQGGKGRPSQLISGGSRFSTSVGGSLMGFHGDIIIVDDPINPQQAVSDIELPNVNRWMEQTLPTRKTSKEITPTVLIMQRLHQDDPSGHILSKEKENIRHICLPGEIKNFADFVRPPEAKEFYIDDLLDPNRMSWRALKDLEADLGQYAYAGQVGQNPVPPGGGMFKVDQLSVMTSMPHQSQIVKTVRYWDKAGTDNAGAYTAGVKMSLLLGGKWLIEDIRRGRWGTDQREAIIKSVAEADGDRVHVWIEQEPGSGGKESAEATIRNLAGFCVYADKPTGNKVFRADPFSVQVNNRNVILLTGIWHRDFIDELRFFPNSTYKDQVDASSGAFQKLLSKKEVQVY